MKIDIKKVAKKAFSKPPKTQENVVEPKKIDERTPEEIQAEKTKNIESRRKFIINVVYVVIILAICYFVLKYLSVWLLPFVIGFICSLVLNRPVEWLTSKTKIPKGLWSALFVTIILSIIFVLIGLIAWKIYGEIVSLAGNISNNLPGITASAKDFLARFSEWSNNNLPSSILSSIETLPATALSRVINLVSSAASNIATTVISNVPGLFLTFIISIVACSFMTSRYKENTQFILKQFSPKNQELIVKSKDLFMENVMKMLRGYIIILFITFAELFLGFTIIGIDYAFILAAIIAFFDILPVIGVGTALIPWAVFQICVGHYALGIELLVMYVIITVIRQNIEPKIIGQQVGLSPVVTLMAMYLGVQVFGFIGMIGLPLIIIVLVKLQECGLAHIWKD